MPGSFVHRRINVSFSMGQGATGAAGLTNWNITGKRVSAKIILPGQGVKGSCSLQVYGMTLSAMNALSKTGWQAAKVRENTVRVEAGDDENGMSTVFEGTITYAWPDMTNQPQVVFRVEAQTGQFDAVKPAEPTSFKGPTPFKTAAEAIAKKFSKPRMLQLGSITKMLDSPYFYGSALKQFESLAKQARVAWVDENEKILAAWPMNGARPGGGGNVISKETGMVADPIGTQTGILVKQLFTRGLTFGTTVMVKSIIDQANGSWAIRRLEYSLESEMPHGEWFVTIDAYKAGAG